MRNQIQNRNQSRNQYRINSKKTRTSILVISL
jgi:hypothetical protein